MPTFATIQADANERKLIRKVQRAVAFLGKSDVELPESIFAVGGGLIDLKALGWKPVGIVTPDGYKFSRSITKEDVDALGYATPARSDITKVARQVTFTPLEHGRRHILELKYGQDLSAVTQDATSGEIVFDEVDLPSGEEYKLLILGNDGPASENWVMGKGYGSVKLADSGEEAWGGSDPVKSDLTLDVFVDEETGTPVRHYLGGTGALKYKDVLGFTATQ
ncbi:hypothetical protein ABC337_05025 [Arthrobacter sp. 1P04PC]|uniref:hypothetical protein n=1 Tax=unclassified Arthrobacter TaxID=235627 RepID=UPI00399FFFF7